MSTTPPSEDRDRPEIKVTSLVGYKTGLPLVELRWGDESGQLTADEARAHAHKVLDAAEAAETDLFITTWLTDKVGLKISQAVQMLQEFRAWRAQRGTSDAPD